ncbi:MAG TPA: hypothetical protein VN495_03045 [Candidatus Paceibacterota bacterium]|nr:hypothetical protein [Candidatus Paceibacterota bacterium]
MADTFALTRDNERLLRKLQRANKVPSHWKHLNGFNLFHTVDQDGEQAISTLLGPLNSGRRGRKPAAIPISTDAKNRPIPGEDDRLYRADVDDTGEITKLVRQQKKGVAVRIFTTGLLISGKGGTMQDMMQILSEKKHLRYHGVFPITRDAADVVGEGIDVNVENASRVVTDERFGRIRGLVGVPKTRETMVEVKIGGPILVGQVDGSLKIVELTNEGWQEYDVTGSAKWQKKFMDLAAADVEYLAEIEEAARLAKRREKTLQVIKAPANYEEGE